MWWAGRGTQRKTIRSRSCLSKLSKQELFLNDDNVVVLGDDGSKRPFKAKLRVPNRSVGDSGSTLGLGVGGPQSFKASVGPRLVQPCASNLITHHHHHHTVAFITTCSVLFKSFI